MTSSLKILSEAAIDIKDITNWYAEISSNLAKRFVVQLFDGFTKIAENPDAWFNVAKNVRRYKLQDFPYIILFLKENKSIFILGVIHEKRKPKIWKSRIKRK